VSDADLGDRGGPGIAAMGRGGQPSAAEQRRSVPARLITLGGEKPQGAREGAIKHRTKPGDDVVVDAVRGRGSPSGKANPGAGREKSGPADPGSGRTFENWCDDAPTGRGGHVRAPPPGHGPLPGRPGPSAMIRAPSNKQGEAAALGGARHTEDLL